MNEKTAPSGRELPVNYVQTVPDQCDRIVWRNAYYHLASLVIAQQAAPLPAPAKDAEIESLKLRLLSASEGSQRAKEAEAFYRDAERMLTTGDKELHGQIAALTAERDALRSVALEFDRLMLVIESAVRHSNPENHASVMALIRANRAAMTKDPTSPAA